MESASAGETNYGDSKNMIMKKRSLFLSAALGIALTLTAGTPSVTTSGLQVEGTGQPRVSFQGAVRLPAFPGFSGSGFNLENTHGANTPATAIPPRAKIAEVAAQQRANMWRAASMGELRGLLTFRNSWMNAQAFHSGIYSIPTTGAGGNYMQLTADSQDTYNGSMAGWTPDGYFIAVPKVMPFVGITYDMVYNVVNPDDWSVISSSSGHPTGLVMPAMTYNRLTGNVNVFYSKSITYTDKEFGFASFDINSGRLDVIRTYEADEPEWRAMSFGKDNNLYAVRSDGDLLKVNLTTGDYTVVGNTGIDTNCICGACYDNVSDTFYLTVQGKGLYSVNCSDGTTNPVLSFNDSEQFIGLYYTNDAAPAAAPAAVSNLEVARDKADLTVDVKFTMPTATFDGTPASGAAGYDIYVNGIRVKSGNSSYGNAEDVKVTVEESAYYSVCVIPTNSEGNGEPNIVKTFIGYDTLLPVTNVKMEYADNKFNVSWDKPLPVFDGYIDYSQVTYTVTRMPDNQVVADGISETSFTDTTPLIPGSESYYFNVVANYRGESTSPVSSNAQVIGIIVPPFRESFETQESFDRFTRLNNDSHLGTWMWHYTEFYVCDDIFYVSEHDDWLLSPAIYVEAGKTYQISIDTKERRAGSTGSFALWAGDECSIEGMTERLLEKDDFTDTDWHTLTCTFIPEKSGMVYFGFQAHGSGLTIYADNFYISAPLSAAAPDAATGIDIIPADYGKLEAKVTFTAPAKTIDGNTLSDIDNITVSRNGTEIAVITDATPGKTVTVTDDNKDGGIINGLNEYAITASNSEGSGRSVSAKAYIGYSTPAGTASVTAVKGDKPNKVQVSWEPVTHDIHGNTLPLEGVTYTLARIGSAGDSEIIYQGAGTSFTDEACGEADEQFFCYYGVIASIDELNSRAIGSPIVAAGKPYDVPYGESFAEKSLSSIWGTQSDSNDYNWGIYSDADVIGMSSADGDNGMAIMSSGTDATGVSASLYSGFVNLTDSKNPCLIFYYYGYDSDNTISVMVNEGQGYVVAGTFPISEGGFWTRKVVDLKPYVGKNIQIAFRGTINDNPLIAIDAISIDNVYADDLNAVSLKAPRKADPDVDVPIVLNYSNDGLNVAKDYTITLLRNGEEVETHNGKSLKGGEKAELTFNTRFSTLDTEDVDFTAAINYDADGNKENNEAKCTIGVRLPEYPIANNLTAHRNEQENVVAEWSDPDLSQTPYETTVDGAESYPAFSIGLPHSVVSGDNLGEWKVIDGDGIKTLSLNNVDYSNEGAEMAWMAFNNVNAGLYDSFPTYEGEQMFVCFAAGQGSTDDWLISPELQGCAQSVSFMAQTVIPDLGLDQFEFYYSTTGNNREDFRQIDAKQSVPGEWTEYSFNLPEGARYFAIRCVSPGGTYALAVDNISFIKADAKRMDLAVNGYNLYRNAKRVNSEPIVENTYLDTDPEAFNAGKYRVTVVYDRGESAPTAPVTVSAATGIAQIEGVKVSVDNGTLVIAGAEGRRVTIVSVSGIVMADLEAQSTVRVPLDKGIYTLRIGKRTVKVII